LLNRREAELTDPVVVRYDVLKLKTGGQSFQQVTQLAERAMSLAQEVDNAVYVAEEMRKLGVRDSGVVPRRSL